MKKFTYFNYIMAAMLSAAMLTTSCTKDLDKTNPSYATLDNYFKNSAEMLKGTNAIYSAFHAGNLIGREWFFVHDLRSDDVSSGGGQLEVPRAQILNGATSSDNPVLGSVWRGLYTVIHRANTVIGSEPNVTDNDEVRDQCVAQAKFFRAWAYFELVTLWGGVPVYTTVVSAPDQFQPRVAEDAVYTQIIKDLTEAVAVLKPTYGTSDLGRVTSGAANAMLGRVHLQKGDYAAAKEALLKVTGAGLYRLVDNYIDNFLEETEFNAESIWEAVYFDRGDNGFDWNGTGDGAGTAQSTIRNQEYSPVAWRNLIPSNKFINEFENTATGAPKTDPRFSNTVYQTGDRFNNDADVLTDAMQNGNSSVLNGVTKKISWRKFMIIYKQSLSAASYHPGGNNQRIIRYAEVLLMLAECENELGNTGAAVGYLNQIRSRASVDMPAYPTAQYPVSNKQQVTRALMHEKWVEMGGEEIRNRDILRWRKKGYFTTDPLPYFRANRDELLPIPQQEIDNNPELGAGGIAKQNQGY
ncbi:RagB/SusD family nutrient uptake outer membrane protein [Chitinophaga rhizophila]|uniref:RagB/SusD family nutrient uptake outer membrane protein n=1 Tax=Chitinophaga rhizophila TaxID=2866212 RepID=A0ABS7GL62_9BACT|nr:RagB/SusD family nutrient uptake outer membrane protein [Chitinophaga rhizophila]MBW8687392.1 RagB/SusD family nutrient uptake outer membrane protein [Chitinophaga rhizophila]